MAMLVYTTGNGYHCGCCRHTIQDYTYFDSDDTASLIKECCEIAGSYDWDFYVNTVEGYDGDSDELERQIMAAIKQAEKDYDRKRKISDLQSRVKDIDRWFANLETTKAENSAKREKLLAELTELGA